MAFLHGITINEATEGARPIPSVSSNVIGVVAPDPFVEQLTDINITFPQDTPKLVTSLQDAAALYGENEPAGFFWEIARAIYENVRCPLVFVRTAYTEVLDEPDVDQIMADIIGGETAGERTGSYALLDAQSSLGVKPSIIITPGWTGLRPEDSENPGTYLANPVVTGVLPIAERMKAVIVADTIDFSSLSTTDAEAVQWASDFASSDRVYATWPLVSRFDVFGEAGVNYFMASVFAAARFAAVEFWESPSNTVINGIVGVNPQVDFEMGDPASRANILNNGNVTTIIREQGFRLWGNLACDGSFISVRRTKDVIAQSVQNAHLWAVDRGITRTYVEQVVESVNAYLRDLKAQGAILGGECYANEELNTPTNIAQGKVFFDFRFTPVYPAQEITFTMITTNDYIEEVFA